MKLNKTTNFTLCEKKSYFPWFFSIFSILTLFNISSTEALEPREEYLIESSYTQIRSLTHSLVTEFPPSKHIYVGVGRSPTPLIAFLQSIDKKAAINLPLSNFRYGGSDQIEMNRESLELIHQHFEKVFSQYKGKGKTIVFIDYIESGKTLFSVQKYYNQFKKNKRGMPKALSAGLSERGTATPSVYRGSNLRKPRMFHLKESLGKTIRDQEWKDIAEYERTNMNTLKYGPPQKTSPHTYRTLKTRFMAKQKKDKSHQFFEILKGLSLSNQSKKCSELMKSLLNLP